MTSEQPGVDGHDPVAPGAGPGVGGTSPWGLADAAVGLAAGVVGGIVSTSAWAVLQGSPRASLGMVVTGLVGLWTGYLVVMTLVSRRKGSGNLARDLGLGVRSVGELLLGALTGLVTGLILVPLLYLLFLGLGVLDEEMLERLSEPAERLIDTAGGAGFLLLAVLVGLGAPLVEECFFRGFVQPAAIRRFGRAAGVIGTAALFAGAHFQALQFPALFLFGLLLGLLALRTGRIGSCVMAHVAFNGLTLVRLAVQG